MSTRRLIVVLLAVSAAAAIAPLAVASDASSQRTTTPIKHFVTLMQENHTYDNYFGTFPKGNGLPKGVCMPVHPSRLERGCIKPFHIGDNAIVPRDLDHSEATSRRQLNGGRMNGFVHALNLRNQDGRLAMGYYDERDLPYYWNLAREYVLYDRFFSSAQGGSFVNHIYWVAGQSGGGDGEGIPENGVRGVPTIFDRLEAKGISWKFYIQNYDPRITYRSHARFPGNRASQVIWAPLLNFPRYLDDPRLSRHIVDLDEYFDDLEQGTLPAVSYIVPSGPSEHPPSSLASGQAFTRSLVNGLMRSSSWKTSAFLLAYDDYGGWYDHVRPPKIDRYGYGFRVPALLVSPYARRGAVDSTELEFSSILKFIEENWRIAPLAARDRRANSIVAGFDFAAPPRAPRFVRADTPTLDNASVRRPLIYVFYLGALGATLVPVAWVLARRRHGRAPPKRPIAEEGGS